MVLVARAVLLKLGRVMLLRYHPFAGSSNPVGQVTLRCNFDVQCMARVFVEPSGRAMCEEELQLDSGESGRGANAEVDAEPDALRDDAVSEEAVPLETDVGLAGSGRDPYARDADDSFSEGFDDGFGVESDEGDHVESFCGDLESLLFEDGPKSCNKDAFGAEVLELSSVVFVRDARPRRRIRRL